MNLHEKQCAGLPYADFLNRYGKPADIPRWKQLHSQASLTDAQKALLKSFTRQMPILCLAGAWCGDCVNQCPIFEHFAAVTPTIQVRYLDRDEHADVQKELQICGGNRVPVLVFFTEDGHEVARYGERTLSKYRALMHELAGRASDGRSDPSLARPANILAQVTQDWLNEFERVQWILRLSPRLRKIHND